MYLSYCWFSCYHYVMTCLAKSITLLQVSLCLCDIFIKPFLSSSSPPLPSITINNSDSILLVYSIAIKFILQLAVKVKVFAMDTEVTLYLFDSLISTILEPPTRIATCISIKCHSELHTLLLVVMLFNNCNKYDRA